jgi:DNA-directed RNA polymerase specialized sigma24 family protein
LLRELYTISIQNAMPDNKKLIRDLRQAEARFQRARNTYRAAAADRAAAFRKASEGGLSLRQIAEAIGITFARVREVMRSGDDS